MSFVTEEIPLLHLNNKNGTVYISGHTELGILFRRFEGIHPEARKYEHLFDPTPWTEVGARPFIFVQKKYKQKLFQRWELQLNKFLEKKHV
jgi:hypothetical protein